MLKLSLDKIEFLDIKEINKPSIDTKMKKIMQKFGCNVPQENCNDILMHNSCKYSIYLWLPLELQVKLNNQEIKILFLAYKERQDFVSLASEISEDGKLNNYDVCVHKDDLESLKQDSTKYEEVIKYLKDFVAKIKEMLEYQEKQYIVVEDILEHLRKNEKIRVC
ncbi:DUF2972 domain-containing protein [Helicobacter burdigaliensis]|uniref:DUF2972 domain-containing protein n=1 Tax=Helicobacter burdigaliensis TaxID=2315334 RepID=UPI000EF726F4|nr:DUF2972 domain-containing protein [Helicobacter burdigaliensis]